MDAGLRVVVVGGGVLGASTAAHLAARGAAVTLVTEAGLASGASGRSLGWLNSSGSHPEEYRRLRMLGIERYRAFAARTDSTAHIAFGGGLLWSTPEQTRSAFERMRSVGYPAEWLSLEQVRDRVPGVAAAAVPGEGVVLNPDEGWVDLPSLIGQLATDLRAAGGVLCADAGRCELLVRRGRVTGVRTAAGDALTADVVVLATGAAVPGTLADLGVHLPDGSTNALLVRTPPVDTQLRVVLNTPRVALRPAPGSGLVIDAGWAEEEVGRNEDGSFEARDSTVQGLLREASRVLAGHPPLTAESYGVGRKPIPGDGLSVLGAVQGVPGLQVAFTHSGATLGLIAGELLAEEVLRGRPDPRLDAFRPARFPQG